MYFFEKKVFVVVWREINTSLGVFFWKVIVMNFLEIKKRISSRYNPSDGKK
jgi:hypothetical protein